MHNEYMVHAIEGVMVSTKNGILKLLDLFKKGKESHQIFVISPVTDNELSLTGLLERAENKDERLWAVIERSRNSWLELSENSLESDVTSFVTDAINASFAKVEDILKAVWLLEKSSEQSRNIGQAGEDMRATLSNFSGKVASSMDNVMTALLNQQEQLLASQKTQMQSFDTAFQTMSSEQSRNIGQAGDDMRKTLSDFSGKVTSSMESVMAALRDQQEQLLANQKTQMQSLTSLIMVLKS